MQDYAKFGAKARLAILLEFMQDLSSWANNSQRRILLPIIILMVTAGGLIMFAQAASAPFIYTLF